MVKVPFGIFGAAFFALVFLFPNSAAHAQSCSSGSYSYNSSCSGNSAAAGSTVSASSTVLVSANQTAGLVLDRVSSFRAGGAAPGQQANGGNTVNLLNLGSGKSAAGKARGLGIWVNGAFSDYEGDKSGAKFDGQAYSGMVGADFRATDRVIIGLSAGYETSDTDTNFNNGNVEGTGFTLAPYVAVQINKTFSVDGLLGYSNLDYDQDRLDPLSAAKITGSTDATRFFGSLNLVGNWRQDKFNLSGRVGTFYLSEEQDAFTESDGTAVAKQNITVGTASLGGRVGYAVNDMVEPYVSATYGYDYNDAGGTYDGRNAYGGAVGIQVDGGNGFTANIEGNAAEKDDVRIYGGSLFLRYNLNF